MKNSKINIVILIVLALSLVVTLGQTISQRMKIEEASDGVEIIFDYDKLIEIEDYEETTMVEWVDLATNNEAEKYSIALKSEFMEDYALDKGIYYATVSATKNSLVSGLIDPQVLEILDQFDDQTILIKTAKVSDRDFLENAFSFYDFLDVTEYNVGDDYYIIVDHKFNDSLQFNSIPLGFDSEKVAKIRETGAQLILRPLNYNHDPKGSFDLFVSEAEKHNMDSKIMFFENEVLGYDRDEPETIKRSAEYIVKNDMTFQIVESAQLSSNLLLEGYEELIEEIGYGYSIRMFNVWDFIATKYQYAGVYKGAEEIENTIFRAVSERNNRAVVLNIIRNKDNTKYITDPEVYMQMLTNLEDRLEIQGISYGDATPFEEYEVSRMLLYLMAIQVVIFVVVLLNLIFGDIGLKYNVILGIVGVLGTIAIDVLSRDLFLNIMSLAAGITLSTIAVLYYLKYVLCIDNDISKKRFSTMWLNVFVTIVIATIGGLFIASFKSRIQFLLVFETFVGVKLSLMAPIALLIIALFVYFVKQLAEKNKSTVKDELVTNTTKFLHVYIKMYYVIIFGFVALAGLLYLMRSGNTGATPSTVEFMIRNYFENNLFARPRNKELFMAVPMTIVGLMFIRSDFIQKNIYTKFIFASAISLCVVIETTSIINTFSHRTPLDMSIYRTFAAVFFGAILGLIYTLIVKLFILICKKINNKFKLVG